MRIAALAISGLLILAGLALWVQERARSTTPAEQQAVDDWAEEEPETAAIPAGGTPQGRSGMPAVPTVSKASKEERRFARYDKDRNGTIARTEMLGSRVKDFRKLDTNGDNFLAFDEWAIATAKRFDGADKDRSGTLTPGEFATTAPKPRAKPRCRC